MTWILALLLSLQCEISACSSSAESYAADVSYGSAGDVRRDFHVVDTGCTDGLRSVTEYNAARTACWTIQSFVQRIAELDSSLHRKTDPTHPKPSTRSAA
jgi:hypothetical protein